MSEAENLLRELVELTDEYESDDEYPMGQFIELAVQIANSARSIVSKEK